MNKTPRSKWLIQMSKKGCNWLVRRLSNDLEKEKPSIETAVRENIHELFDLYVNRDDNRAIHNRTSRLVTGSNFKREVSS